jgi:divalent metal cation (Fe/Co/Zn/Cd) transporter
MTSPPPQHNSLDLTPLAPKGDTCPDACCTPQALATPCDGDQWHRAARRARALSWLSLAWMSVEGVIGLFAGVNAGSIALIGWALGSVIEGLASIIVIWRFTGSRTLSETAEHTAQRAVAVSFFLLAPYLAVEAVHNLISGHQTESSPLGIAVTAASLILMPALGTAKKRLGSRLGSGATAGEGTQNLICAAQAATVLIGLAATAALGWSWLDPVIALLLATWAVYEGKNAWRGNTCCA